ncbi:MAG: hypothetical protein AVDCRST_MAG05-3707, partial [uncultured Rubrobacteraceae bacterium]
DTVCSSLLDVRRRQGVPRHPNLRDPLRPELRRMPLPRNRV